MKKITALFFAIVWILVFVFMATSCNVVKNWKKKKETIVEHHYHDSTHVIENLTIREITAKPDSTKAYFDLKKLIASGYGKSTDRYFTTEIKYAENGLTVTTTIDSLIQIVKELQRQTVQSTVNQQSKTETELKESNKTKESFIFPVWVWWLIGILLVVAVVVYFYLKMIRLK